MTLDYLQNACTLNFNKNGTYNFQSIRKGMYAEIFFMFILYFLTQLYQSVFFYREEGKTEQQPLADKNTEQVKEEGTKTTSRFVPSELPWHQRKWTKMFPILYGNHAVALALNLMYNPFASGLVTAFIHLLFFGAYLAGNIRRMRVLLGVAMTGMAISNLVLLILGLTSINRNNFISPNSYDCQYR